jgi:hypothetical protein
MGEQKAISLRGNDQPFDRLVLAAQEEAQQSWPMKWTVNDQWGSALWEPMTVVVAGEDVSIDLIQRLYEAMKSAQGIDAPCALVVWLNEEPQSWNLRCRVLVDEIVKILGLRAQQLAMSHTAAHAEIYRQSVCNVDGVIEMLTHVPSLNYLIPTDYCYWGD